jgi:HPt (histidine-containing phosphotransfer) domain-containing protein
MKKRAKNTSEGNEIFTFSPINQQAGGYMINWARVVELREEIGAEDFDEVVELFLCEVEERVEHLDSEKPLSEIEEDLHFLKGSALNLGFTSFANLCHEGEIKAQTGQIFSKLGEVESAFIESKGLFLSELKKMVAA